MNEATSTLSPAREVLDKEGQYLFPSVKHMYAEPIVMDEGQGVWVRDVDGREYLDLFSGILTTSIGHRHPEVHERVRGVPGCYAKTEESLDRLLELRSTHRARGRKMSVSVTTVISKMNWQHSPRFRNWPGLPG